MDESLVRFQRSEFTERLAKAAISQLTFVRRIPLKKLYFALVLFICYVVSITSIYAAPLDGLVLHLTFDEGQGDTAQDASGNGNNGTLVGNLNWVSGKTGSALQFDGAENASYVEVADDPSLNPATEITCSAWIYFDTFLGSGGIISKYIGAGNQRSYTIHMHHDNPLGIAADFSSSGVYKAGTSAMSAGTDGDVIKEGEWQHVAVTFKAQEFLRIYINGQMQAEEEVVAGVMDTIFDNNVPLLIGNDFQIGGSHRAGQPREFTGIIDEVMIFNRELSAQEIQSIMSGATASVEPGGKLATRWSAIKN